MKKELENPHIKRLYDSIAMYADEDTAKKISCNVSISKTPNIKKKFAWAQDICNSLEESFDDNVIKDIRMSCACGPSNGHMEKLKRMYEACDILEDFAVKYNCADLGSTLVVEDSKILFSYPECYCGVVKRVEQQISKTWCYCTLGYTKKMFEYVFGCEVKVDLLESIKTGGEKCLMEVERV